MTDPVYTGRGFVRITMGDLTFTVDLPQPLTVEQMRSLAKVSTAMTEVAHLFQLGGDVSR